MVQRLFDLAGIGKERLHLAWISSAEAQRFADVASHVVESIKALGPLDREALEMALTACQMALDSDTLRWLVGKEVKLTSSGDVYGRVWSAKEYESLLDDLLEREFHKNLIYLAVKEGCPSVRDIGKRIGLDLKRISYLLADLEKTNRIEFQGMEDSKPIFVALDTF
jgi:hypothetical protein